METPTPQTEPGKAQAAALEPVIIRADKRKQFSVPGNPIHYEKLTPEGTASMAMFSVDVSPGQSTGPKELEHKGDEQMLVVSGTVEVVVEDLSYTLASGDSVFIPRGARHRVTNVGAGAATAVFVLSPPEYS